MNRGVVAAIAIGVLLAAIFIAETDASRNGQIVAMGVGLFASIIILIGILSEAGEWGGHSSTRGDTTQTVNITMPSAPQYQPLQNQPQVHPAWLAPPPAAPSIIMMPSPAPAPGAPQMLLVTPEMLAQGLLPHQPAASLPSPHYRGALDVVAEPARHVQQSQPVAALPSPSMARRVASRMFGGREKV